MKLDKPKGSRGSWLATLGGDSIPCVHKYWRKGNYYDDPGLFVGNKQHDKFVAEIESRKLVIMTEDDVLELLERGASFKRTGYLSLWAIDFVEFDDHGLRFLFTNKIAEF